ncbi:universal stress protein [Boseongicola aestuarii]|uniref:Universal stress protein F n=1 Tax=Boseongicola aestuarii TaxID=1470561 RepID=A0A238J776_9RHOB|nr:universal stress protein [Boseongicola aestuarii]SMX25800.1 Universal stress protein F [Boseongicola aestuarii]
MYTKILVPVDLDNVERLSKALNLAGQTAQANHAEVVYVDVVDAVPTMSVRTEGDRMAVRLKDFVAAQAKQYHIKANDHVALRGDLHLNVGADIIKAAKEADCDLIVMASHLPGLKDHIFSSNAGYVASHAPMSVYVVR